MDDTVKVKDVKDSAENHKEALVEFELKDGEQQLLPDDIIKGPPTFYMFPFFENNTRGADVHKKTYSIKTKSETIELTKKNPEGKLPGPKEKRAFNALMKFIHKEFTNGGGRIDCNQPIIISKAAFLDEMEYKIKGNKRSGYHYKLLEEGIKNLAETTFEGKRVFKKKSKEGQNIFMEQNDDGSIKEAGFSMHLFDYEYEKYNDDKRTFMSIKISPSFAEIINSGYLTKLNYTHQKYLASKYTTLTQQLYDCLCIAFSRVTVRKYQFNEIAPRIGIQSSEPKKIKELLKKASVNLIGEYFLERVEFERDTNNGVRRHWVIFFKGEGINVEAARSLEFDTSSKQQYNQIPPKNQKKTTVQDGLFSQNFSRQFISREEVEVFYQALVLPYKYQGVQEKEQEVASLISMFETAKLDQNVPIHKVESYILKPLISQLNEMGSFRFRYSILDEETIGFNISETSN